MCWIASSASPSRDAVAFEWITLNEPPAGPTSCGYASDLSGSVNAYLQVWDFGTS
jgi:hypothetical protein